MKRFTALDHGKKRKHDGQKEQKVVSATNKKKRITPQEAIDMFPDSRGLFIAEDDTLRCQCNNKLGERHITSCNDTADHQMKHCIIILTHIFITLRSYIF